MDLSMAENWIVYQSIVEYPSSYGGNHLVYKNTTAHDNKFITVIQEMTHISSR